MGYGIGPSLRAEVASIIPPSVGPEKTRLGVKVKLGTRGPAGEVQGTRGDSNISDAALDA